MSLKEEGALAVVICTLCDAPSKFAHYYYYYLLLFIPFPYLFQNLSPLASLSPDNQNVCSTSDSENVGTGSLKPTQWSSSYIHCVSKTHFEYLDYAASSVR